MIAININRLGFRFYVIRMGMQFALYGTANHKTKAKGYYFEHDQGDKYGKSAKKRIRCDYDSLPVSAVDAIDDRHSVAADFQYRYGYRG